MYFTLMISLVCALFGPMAQANDGRQVQAPVGAAVSWVPYDNRPDFVAAVQLIKTIIQSPSSSDAETSLFNIDPAMHFPLNVDATLDGSQGPTFSGALSKAISSLEMEVLLRQKAEPFLAVVVASHGGQGWLSCQANSGGYYLTELAQMILNAAQKFYKFTGVKLRLEFLYSACFSGGLIEAFHQELRKNPELREQLGPLTILTVTDDRKESWVNMTGDPILVAITRFKNAMVPSLSQFGFFQHLGAGGMNFPQFYTTGKQWTEEDTFQFLKSRRHNFHDDLFSLYNRDLKLDLLSLAGKAKTILDAFNVIGFASWNMALEKRPERILMFLNHPLSQVRYGAALRILYELDGDFKYRQGEQFKAYGPRAKELVYQWLQEDQMMQMLGDSDGGSMFMYDYFSIIPLEGISNEAALAVLKKVRKPSDPLEVDRVLMDHLRKLLINNFNIHKQSDDMNWSGKPKNLDLSRVPSDFLTFMLKVYFQLPDQTLDQEVMNKIIERLTDPRRQRSEMGYRAKREACQQILSAQDYEVRIREWASTVIRHYDRGIYLDFEPWTMPGFGR